MNTLQQLKNQFGVFTEYTEIPNIGRDDLAKFISTLGFESAVEVGVASGEYSEIIMRNNPHMIMWGVDPYEKYDGYHDYKLRSTFERMEREAHQRLDQYNTYHFVKEFSVDAAKNFKDESIDFIYLDGNHSGPAVKEDIETWAPKVRSDGILAGHDFTNRWPSLKKEVIQYCQNNNKQLFVLGLERKDLGLYRDASRSWMVIC